jgi:hypothetical protein
MDIEARGEIAHRHPRVPVRNGSGCGHPRCCSAPGRGRRRGRDARGHGKHGGEVFWAGVA